ncbi:MAG: diguanylate cyclase [Helicobacteraceae bacterium]|nr:diguanylate cyclase [Helicobacteraceae bacterium]
MKHYKIYLIVFVAFSILTFVSLQYIDFLKHKKDDFEKQAYTVNAEYMQKTLAQMIEVKQKSTAAIALSLANDKQFVKNVAEKKMCALEFQELSKQFRQHTLYKNIWVQVFDDKANILYRSWTDKQKENVFNVRKDIQDVIASKKVLTSINPGRHSLSIRAIVPLFLEKKFVGMIEIISHFNSISKSLKKSDIDSIVILKKEFTQQLKYPMTKMFLKDYYIANYDAPKSLQNYLIKYGIESYLNNSYRVENGCIVVSYELKDVHSNPVGYYIMSKKLSDISNIGIEFYMFKWVALSVILVMFLVILLSIFLYYTKARDKKYYQNIINGSSNIIFINNPFETIEVNDTFYKFFKEFQSFEEFKQEHTCISDYFLEEEGCLTPTSGDQNWLEYLIEHKGEKNSVKMELAGEIKYFSISASLISEEKKHYAIIMADITEQETYKKELEHLTITDTLTGIGNRRYFHNKMAEECARASRYEYPLSFILFDIDYFKQVNDEYGHNVGDEVLKEYTSLIAPMLRENDTFCRIGGEEFMILLPHVDKDKAQKIAEKIRVAIEKSEKIVPITMSFGVTQYISGEEEESVFKRVDQALYKAKENGRNRVVVG